MQNLSINNDFSMKSCQGSSFSEVHTRANCYLCLNNTHCLFSIFLCLVTPSIFRHPERDLYEQFFWKSNV